MLKSSDPSPQAVKTRIRELALQLRKIKPEGWSVVLNGYAISVRPKDRTIGKFIVASSLDGRFSAHFFSRQLNIWNKLKYFSDDVSLAGRIKDWMSFEVIDPLSRVSE